MNLQSTCTVVGTAITVLSWMFGGSLVEHIGELNMLRLMFAISMGIGAYCLSRIICELFAYFRKESMLQADLELLDIERLSVLRTLWENRYLEPTDRQYPACIFLHDAGLVTRTGLRGFKLTATGKKVCRKLAKKDF